MKKILVLATIYPNNKTLEMMYVHTRNKYYIKNNLDVTVLSFKTSSDYKIDGINVISLRTYKNSKTEYDLLIIHAPNIRNHYIFLKRYGNRFKKHIFFYHGHEVMKTNKQYVKPYKYVEKNLIKNILQDLYDYFKLYIWKKYLIKNIDNLYLVFVSNWMYYIFIKNFKLDLKFISGRYSIIYNNVDVIFEKESYNSEGEKIYDFITIRSNLDGSKYAIDIVNRLAQNTPNCKFLIVGKGEFFNHFKKSDNIEWKNQTMSHNEIIDVLQKSKFALMPTRTDSQGLMMCEMAAFGIPLITSDIDICHEIFDGFSNVYFINNDDDKNSLSDFMFKENISKKDSRFYMNSTVKKEVELIKSLLKDM